MHTGLKSEYWWNFLNMCKWITAHMILRRLQSQTVWLFNVVCDFLLLVFIFVLEFCKRCESLFSYKHHACCSGSGWRGTSSPRMRGYEPDRLGPRGSSRGSPRGSPRARNDRPYYMRGSNQYMGSGPGMGNFSLQQQPQQQPQQQQQRSYTWGTRSWGQNQT